MKWVEKFPDPGPQPPHPGDGPKSMSALVAKDGEVYKKWHAARRAYNDWLFKNRRHRVATGLDAIAETKAEGPLIDIVSTLAIAYLDGELSNEDRGILGLFGL